MEGGEGGEGGSYGSRVDSEHRSFLRAECSEHPRFEKGHRRAGPHAALEGLRPHCWEAGSSEAQAHLTPGSWGFRELESPRG